MKIAIGNDHRGYKLKETIVIKPNNLNMDKFIDLLNVNLLFIQI